jgi:hypothetical protein
MTLVPGGVQYLPPKIRHAKPQRQISRVFHKQYLDLKNNNVGNFPERSVRGQGAEAARAAHR